MLAAGTLSYPVAALPAGKMLYATLYTLVHGKWAYQEIGFTTAGT